MFHWGQHAQHRERHPLELPSEVGNNSCSTVSLLQCYTSVLYCPSTVRCHCADDLYDRGAVPPGAAPRGWQHHGAVRRTRQPRASTENSRISTEQLPGRPGMVPSLWNIAQMEPEKKREKEEKENWKWICILGFQVQCSKPWGVPFEPSFPLQPLSFRFDSDCPGIVRRAVGLGRYAQNRLALMASLFGPKREILALKLHPSQDLVGRRSCMTPWRRPWSL